MNLALAKVVDAIKRENFENEAGQLNNMEEFKQLELWAMDHNVFIPLQLIPDPMRAELSHIMLYIKDKYPEWEF